MQCPIKHNPSDFPSIVLMIFQHKQDLYHPASSYSSPELTVLLTLVLSFDNSALESHRKCIYRTGVTKGLCAKPDALSMFLYEYGCIYATLSTSSRPMFAVSSSILEFMDHEGSLAFK